MAVAVITWLWGTKYTAVDVMRLATAVKRNFSQPHRFIVFSDVQQLLGLPPHVEVVPIKDRELMDRSCFCRLRQFDPAWQKENGLNDRIIGIDLDAIITGKLDTLFTGIDSFMILKGVNAVNPNPFNGSVTMLRAGNHANVWRDFSLEKANNIQFHEFPDDQGWIWHKMPRANGWVAGTSSGIYGFKKPGWPKGEKLPAGAKIVVFVGSRKPNQYPHLDWVNRYWRLLAHD